MKTKFLLLAFAASVLAAAPAIGRAQDDVVGESIYELTSLMTEFASGLCTAPVGPCYAEDVSCGGNNCGQCCQCCRQYDIFGSVEFLMWWAKGNNVPPLVTTSDPATNQVDAGVLGLQSTHTLFGNQYTGKELQAGGRATLGVWLDPDHNVAAGGRFFGLSGDTTNYRASSDGSTILARPFYNAFLGTPDALLIGYPNLVAGGINVKASTQNIFGADAFMEVMMLREARRRIDLTFGYQFFRLDDALDIISQHAIIQPGPGFGTQFNVFDTFRAYNEFHGGQMGLRGRFARGCWSVDALGQMAVGGMREQVVINGQTTITPAGGAPAVNSGGLLAQNSNIGSYERTRLTFIPQLTVNLKYNVHPCLAFFVGYNLIWFNNIASTGDQIDTRVNLNQQVGPVGPPLPAFAFHDRDYWIQGINFGGSWDF